MNNNEIRQHVDALRAMGCVVAVWTEEEWSAAGERHDLEAAIIEWGNQHIERIGDEVAEPDGIDFDFPTIRCRFHPQVWVRDYAMEVDPEGPVEWDVPVAECASLDLERADDRDHLRDMGNAPRWIKDWGGPFEVEVISEGAD